MSRIRSTAFVGLALFCATAPASADALPRAGSLLVFPYYDAISPLCAVTVTNTNTDTTPVVGAPGALAAGTVDVEFVYIDAEVCLETNRTRRLTPNDTLTVATHLDNPLGGLGYLYVYAKSPTTGRAIKWDWLIGNSILFNATGSGALNFAPAVFRAGAGLAQGAPTDVDNDFVRDLDGTEYEKVPDKLLVPSFIADSTGTSEPRLVLISLSSPSFTTVVNFLVYNDNEEVFSAQYQFRCYGLPRLRDINGVFTNAFLESTNNNLGEFVTPPVCLSRKPRFSQALQLNLETGWFRMDGSIAYSTAATIQDPAFLAVLLESVPLSCAMTATLPYGVGEQANGDLLPQGPFPN